MNIRQAKDEIKNTVRAYLKKDETGNYQIPAIRQRPLLLIGPPGIGKTQIMEQIARECKIALVSYTITHHTRQSAVGLPFIKEEEYEGKQYSITEYTMSEIIASVYRKMKETGLKEGILFIDEINCVSETLAPTMLQFLQCKTFGNQAVPEGWIIVAAGNPPEYNKSVRDFDMVTLDRVRCMNVEADLLVWKEYARSQHIHSAILSYLELRPANFYRVEADVDGLQYVTARGWEDLSNLMEVYEQLGLSVNEEIVHEFLRHTDVAEDVAAYVELYKKYQDDYGIPEILEGKVKSSVYARIYEAAFDERYSVVNLLLDGLSNLFVSVQKEKRLTDDWYLLLKDYREKVVNAPSPLECYDALVSEKEAEYLQQKNSGLLSGSDEKHYEQLLKLLKTSGIRLKSEKSTATPKESFLYIKEDFDTQRQKLEQLEEKTVQAVEHAFTFMEQAFEHGQEMVIFVTGLTVTPESALFLASHTCERYQKYNAELLIGTKRAELLTELAHGEEEK